MLQRTASTIIMFVFSLFVSVHLTYVKGETYIVGDDDGWSLISNTTNWAQGKEFHVGDTLVFKYEKSLHNVLQVNATAYRDCIKEPSTELFESGNDSLVLTDVGETWYICGVSDHCETGQKLGIIVAP